MDTHETWDVFGQHLVESHGQDSSDPHHTETREIIQTLVSEWPPFGAGHMPSVQRRFRTITMSWFLLKRSCSQGINLSYNYPRDPAYTI